MDKTGTNVKIFTPIYERARIIALKQHRSITSVVNQILDEALEK